MEILAKRDAATEKLGIYVVPVFTTKLEGF